MRIDWHARLSILWARSIQPKFPEISVQNSMDRFGPTGKVSKKRVHLLRWTTFAGRTGWNVGWMDRALWFTWPSRGADGSVNMSYWPTVRSRWLKVEVNNKITKKNGAKFYKTILTEQAWSIRDLLHGQQENVSSRTNAGNPEGAGRAHLTRLGSQSERRIHFILPAGRFSHIKRRS